MTQLIQHTSDIRFVVNTPTRVEVESLSRHVSVSIVPSRLQDFFDVAIIDRTTDQFMSEPQELVFIDDVRNILQAVLL